MRTGPLNRERFVAVQIDLLRFVLPSDHLIRGGCEDHRMREKEEESRAEEEVFAHFRLSLEEFRVVVFPRVTCGLSSDDDVKLFPNLASTA